MGAKLLGRKPHDWSGKAAARVRRSWRLRRARRLGQHRPAAAHLIRRGFIAKVS